ncbi:MAG: DsrE family protein [Marinifilaceae bacterium]
MNTLLQVTRDTLGSGDDILGERLICNYFKQRLAENRLPAVMCFYNAGVKLLASDNEVTEVLKAIEATGVKLLACKTCIDYFELADKMQCGVIGSMVDIITLQDNADKIIMI